VFLIGGQSNAVGNGSASDSPDVGENAAVEYKGWDVSSVDRRSYALDDPVGAGDHEANTGSAWPAFAERYWEETGRRSAYVQAAVGSTAQHSAATISDYGTWDSSGTLTENACDGVEMALDYFDDEYTPRLAGLLWHQGEQDAKAIDSGDITGSMYKDAFRRMVDRFRERTPPPELPVFVHQIGQKKHGDTRGMRTVREAQAELAETVPNTTLAWSRSAQFAPELMTDTWHYNQEALNTMGEASATRVSEYLEF
jgi:hypothetical protein